MNIVLVGAGGTGMSGVAGLLHELGYTEQIVCIDANQSQLTDKLKSQGLKVIIGHGKQDIKAGDIVIYSEATKESPEVKKALQLRKDQPKVLTIVWNYFQFIGEISKYFETIAITGTNGKSSTTSMLIHTARNVLPNFGLGIVGALVPDLENKSYTFNPDRKKEIKTIFDFIFTNKRGGDSFEKISKNLKQLCFFVEACEYKRHFLNLDIDWSIITNASLDHTDYYKDQSDYYNAFTQFIDQTKYKTLIPETEIYRKQRDIKDPSKVIEVTPKKYVFKHLLGEYNNINASLVESFFDIYAQANPTLQLSSSPVFQITNFKGLGRRMELLTETDHGALLYSDYGHMAESIENVYKGLKKKFPNKKLIAVFQPHQVNRVLRERDQFSTTLKKYDDCIIYDIYAAREDLEEELQKTANNKFLDKNPSTIQELGSFFAQACGGSYISHINEITNIIKHADENTIITLFSAGDLDYKTRNALNI